MYYIKIRKTFRCLGHVTPTLLGLLTFKKGAIVQTPTPPEYINRDIATPLSLLDVMKMLQKKPNLLDNVKEMI